MFVEEVPPPPSEILFSDGELGSNQELYQDFSAWTATKHPSQSLTIDDINSVEGDYGFRMGIDSSLPDMNCFARYNFESSQLVIYAQTYVMVTQHELVGGGHYCIFGLDSVFGVNINIGLDKDRRLVKDWQDDSGPHTAVSSTALELNRWYCLKIIVKVGNGDGENRVWLDDVEVMDLQHLNLVNNYSTVILVYIGTTKTFAFTGTATVYFDSVVAGTSDLPLSVWYPIDETLTGYHQLDYNIVINEGCTLRIIDATISFTGGEYIKNYGTLIIENSEVSGFEGLNTWGTVSTNGSVVLNSGV